MSLLNIPPSGTYLAVFELKSRPPINFNLALKSHANKFGLRVHAMSYHPHPSEPKLSMRVSGPNIEEQTRKFVNSAKQGFGGYVKHAFARAGNENFGF